MLDKSSLTLSRSGVADGVGVTLGVAVAVAVAVAAVVGVAVGVGVFVGGAVAVAVAACVLVGLTTSTASVPFFWLAIANNATAPIRPMTNNATIKTRCTNALLYKVPLDCTTRSMLYSRA
ncbi:MAG: hypothetical protein E6J26_02220 [Chloroflexi bacterium]|nr:MAG: hypothetical protein E6J26_02220 [Chloroflexota bacterium]